MQASVRAWMQDSDFLSESYVVWSKTLSPTPASRMRVERTHAANLLNSSVAIPMQKGQKIKSFQTWLCVCVRRRPLGRNQRGWRAQKERFMRLASRSRAAIIFANQSIGREREAARMRNEADYTRCGLIAQVHCLRCAARQTTRKRFAPRRMLMNEAKITRTLKNEQTFIKFN
jgi:hypothetical protein